jgi:hypothetical protein
LASSCHKIENNRVQHAERLMASKIFYACQTRKEVRRYFITLLKRVNPPLGERVK